MENKVFNNINKIILAALTAKQKELIDKIKERNAVVLEERYKDIFNGQDRIYLPDVIYATDDVMTDEHHENKKQIKLMLLSYLKYIGKIGEDDNIWIESKDYINGKITIKDREYKIGRLLNEIKTKKDKIENAGIRNYIDRSIDKMISLFNVRPSGKAKHREYRVVISRDPYDIAGMSTDRRWTSCMELKNDDAETDKRRRNAGEGGCYRFYVGSDIEEGTIIAYLISPEDKNIDDPFARVLIKPYVNKSRTKIYLTPEDIVYKDSVFIKIETAEEFKNIVNEWAIENQQNIKGKFYANPKLYFDGKSSISVGQEDITLAEAVYKSLNIDELFKDGYIVINRAVTSNYIEKISDFVKMWNYYIISKLHNGARYLPYLDISKMTADNYTNLEFPIKYVRNNRYFDRNKKINKYDIILRPEGKTIFNIDELYEIIKDFIGATYKTETYVDNTVIEDINNIKSMDRLDVASYDAILIKDDVKLTNFKNVNPGKVFTDILHETTDFPLCYCYLVSSGQMDYKNKHLMKMKLDLVLYNEFLEEEFRDEYSTEDLLSLDPSAEGFFDINVKTFTVDNNFSLNFKKSTDFGYFCRKIRSNIYTTISLKLKVDFNKLIELYNFPTNREDRYVPASERQIDDYREQARYDFENLEKSIFKDIYDNNGDLIE